MNLVLPGLPGSLGARDEDGCLTNGLSFNRYDFAHPGGQGVARKVLGGSRRHMRRQEGAFFLVELGHPWLECKNEAPIGGI